MTRKPQALCQVKNLVTLPPRALRWDGPQPYIVHKRHITKAKELIVEGSKIYRVKVNTLTWHVQISA
jgi:hypothetical protein